MNTETIEIDGQSYVKTTYDSGHTETRVANAPIIPVQTTMSVLDFRNRFTTTEKTAIYTAAETNISIKILLDDLSSAQVVDLENQDIIDAVNGFESSAIIGPGRASEILSP